MPSPGRILVTGAGGFVGRALVAALRDHGWEVEAAGRAPGAGSAPLDVTRPEEVRRRLESSRPEGVVNLAAIAHRKRARIAPQEYDAVNHRGVANLLDAARRVGVRRFVQFSTASVYGEEGREAPVKEDAERRPVGAYARSKAEAEDRCLEGDPAEMACVVLRLPAVYAPGWLLDVRKRACFPGTGGRVLLRVDGGVRHSLCALENAVDCARLAFEALPPGIYNVADRVPYPQDEVARVVARMDGIDRSVGLPAFAASAALVAARLLPGATGRQLRSHAWKLLRGVVLDTVRVEAAGFVPRRALRDLLPYPPRH